MTVRKRVAGPAAPGGRPEGVVQRDDGQAEAALDLRIHDADLGPSAMTPFPTRVGSAEDLIQNGNPSGVYETLEVPGQVVEQYELPEELEDLRFVTDDTARVATQWTEAFVHNGRQHYLKVEVEVFVRPDEPLPYTVERLGVTANYAQDALRERFVEAMKARSERGEKR